MSTETAKDRRPIIVRRKRPERHGAHGTWKIAYADFMTALMAFFLVMWLLGGLSKIQIDQVSQYFRTPLKVALMGGNQATASDSAIPGGGDDRVHSDGQVSLTTPDAHNYKSGRKKLEDLRKQLLELIQKDPKLRDMASQLKIEMVPDGLRIQIFDTRQRPMFELGSAQLEPYVAALLRKIAPKVDQVGHHITLTGHTDDLPYASGTGAYSNWELSADRANAARRALVAGGMQPDKLLRVIGAADTVHLAGEKAGAPVNRRISILLLDAAAEKRIESQGETQAPVRPLSPLAALSQQTDAGDRSGAADSQTGAKVSKPAPAGTSHSAG
ncbi:MAG: flagellar motor protein MotB [Salinisphaera sp.]|nr:flagellar motor protein MotB [Salinisphaera sp.]